MLKDQAEDIAVAEHRVLFIKLNLLQMPQNPVAHLRQIIFHLAARRKILRLFARRADRIKDSLVALVGRRLVLQLLQEPEGLEDADVRQMPDDWAKPEARTLAQILLARQVKERERLLPGPRHLFGDLFC